MTITDLPTTSFWRPGDDPGDRQFAALGPVALGLVAPEPRGTPGRRVGALGRRRHPTGRHGSP